MTPRGLYSITVLGTLAAAGLAFAALSRPWATVELAASGMPSRPEEFSGTQVAPAATALALVCAAGALAYLATSGALRRLLALVVSTVAALGVALVIRGLGRVDATMRRLATDAASPSPSVETSWWWPAVAAFGFGSVLVLGLLALRRSAGWPALGRRFDRAGVPRRGASPRIAATDDPADVWRALDEGRDPTE